MLARSFLDVIADSAESRTPIAKKGCERVSDHPGGMDGCRPRLEPAGPSILSSRTSDGGPIDGNNFRIVRPGETGILETGDGWSVAAIAAVAEGARTATGATAAGTLSMQTVPPYCRPESVQRMKTS